MASDYVEVNRANWNSRVPLHEKGYGLDKFRSDPAWLSEVVRFDLPRLGDVRGEELVHLQCHIGTDTLSLARLGAKVTGLDFSGPALEVARQLAHDCGADVSYAEAQVYDAVAALGSARFDVVYTGIGALCWLPSIERWANTVSELLKPGGRLFIREGHPVLWALCNPRPDGLLVLDYPYFETAEGTEFVETKTYVDHEGEIGSPRSISFNHGIGEIVTAILGSGLRLTAFEEHRSVPWNPFGEAGIRDAQGEWHLGHASERLPATYTLQATKV
ncbi:MAG TPA: methyltransferase [Polyangiaceae bacterium]